MKATSYKRSVTTSQTKYLANAKLNMSSTYLKDGQQTQRDMQGPRRTKAQSATC